MLSNYRLLFVAPATVLLLLLGSGCRKLVTVTSPDNRVTQANVYENDATATAVLTGVYTSITEAGFTSGGPISTAFFTGLSSDELTLFDANGTADLTQNAYYSNRLTSMNDGYGNDVWGTLYPIIFVVNSSIEGLNSSTSLTPAVKQQLLGESEFMRAFCYFYLVNSYGDVPLVTSTDYTVNQDLPRTPQAQVWQQIISDLRDAQNLLSPNYLDATLLNTTAQRVRPTQWAATALLARAYLYTTDWTGADSAATAVINNSSMYSLGALNSAFLNNNPEAIWQLQSVGVFVPNTSEGMTLILTPQYGPQVGTYPVYLNSNLVNSFEPGDQRRVDWVDSVIVNGITYYYAYKYKINNQTAPATEAVTVLRLAEQYLIRSEARVREGNIAGAQADLDMIRGRAQLTNTTAGDESSLLKAIAHERQDELFLEWGDRWYDLKRTGAVDSVMSVVTPEKGGTWSTNWQWYPIPFTEIQYDPKLVQNTGY